MTEMKAWSFTAVKSYETCPLKYYEESVIKRYPFQETEAIRYGNVVHKLAEDFICGDVAGLPENLKQFERGLTVFRNMPGKKLCEFKMGVTAYWQPCSFFDKFVWARGVADLLILQDDVAYVVDYKTGSSKYPDKKQLELMSMMVFTHFKHIKRTKSALLFIKGPVLIKESFSADQMPELIKVWQGKASKIADSHKKNLWPPRQNGLCKNYCPVETCAFNGANK